MNSRAALLALAVGAFAIGTTEFAPMGLLPVIADGVGVSIPTMRHADHRLRRGRDAGRAGDDPADGPFRQAHRADAADVDLRGRQPAVRAGPQLRTAAAVPPGHQPQPRRVLRHRCGGRRQPGAEGKAGCGRGHHVHGPDHRQHRRRAPGDLGRPAAGLAPVLRGHCGAGPDRDHCVGLRAAGCPRRDRAPTCAAN